MIWQPFGLLYTRLQPRNGGGQEISRLTPRHGISMRKGNDGERIYLLDCLLPVSDFANFIVLATDSIYSLTSQLVFCVIGCLFVSSLVRRRL
jgi:hypothetical protein